MGILDDFLSTTGCDKVDSRKTPKMQATILNPRPESKPKVQSQLPLIDEVDIEWGSADEEITRILAITNHGATPYNVLRLPVLASPKLAKQNFRVLSMLIHPDKSNNSSAGIAFNVLRDSYEQFTNADCSQVYSEVYELAQRQILAQIHKENLIRAESNAPPLSEEASAYTSQILARCDDILKERKERLIYSARVRASNIEFVEKQEELHKMEAWINRQANRILKTSGSERTEVWRTHKSANKHRFPN